MATKKSDDATPAYRGYRKQILFILHTILTAQDGNLIFCPEGVEDLSIENNGFTKSIYQVKDLVNQLTLSDLISEKGSSSFITRAHSYYKENPITDIVLAHYGPLGPELTQLSKKDNHATISVINKIKEKDIIPIDDVAPLIDKITFNKLSEDNIIFEIKQIISSSILGIDSDVAYDFLCWWIFTSSEHKLKITKLDILNKVKNIGEFLRQRSLHHEWLGSIIPFDDYSTSKRDVNLLKDTYLQGISASMLHIFENLDIPRTSKYDKINQSLINSNVLIIHGASGQGKTTLAYRYFYNYLPLQLSYQIKEPDNREHAYNISEAIIKHHKSFQVPMFIYYDIMPNDSYWVELIERLSQESDIKIIATIREEDWRRGSSIREKIKLQDLELDFSKEEAESIFRNIKQDKFLDFKTSWHNFGEKGPLLEYIYFLNFGEKIEDRLRNQINKIKELVNLNKIEREIIDILRIVVLITAYGARVIANKIEHLVKMPCPELLLEKLNKEYLIRLSDGNKVIEGFHPIRSQILEKYLFDDTFSPWIDIFPKAFPAILENDLGTFLLFCFSRRSDPEVETIITSLNNFSPTEWNTYHGIITSLLWLGIKRYAELNRHLVDDLLKNAPHIDISIALDIDICGVNPGLTENLLNLFKELNPDALKIIDSYRKKQSDKTEVFSLLKQWLSVRKEKPLPPNFDNDFLGLCKFAYWLGFLKIKSNLFYEMEEYINSKIDKLDIQIISEISHSFNSLNDTNTVSFIKKHEYSIHHKFFRATGTLFLEFSEDSIKAHYIIPILDNINEYLTSEKRNNNAKSMLIIYLLQKLYPNMNFYSTQGYGHKLLAAELSIPNQYSSDDSYKNIPKENLPQPNLVELNSNLIGYFLYKYRPESWGEYKERIIFLRKLLLDLFNGLIRGLNRYFIKLNLEDIVNSETNTILIKCHSELNKVNLFPKASVDEWGKVREHIDTNSSPNEAVNNLNHNSTFSPSLLKFETYLKASRDLFYNSSCFLNNMTSLILKRSRKEEGNNKLLSSLNLLDIFNKLHLFQCEFTKHFEGISNVVDLHNLEQKENKIYSQLFSLWHFFTFYPDKIIDNPAIYCDEYVRKSFKNIFIRSLQNELNSIDNFTFDIMEVNCEEEYLLGIIVEINHLEYLYDNDGIDLANIISGLHINQSFNKILIKYNKDELIRLLQYHWNSLCFCIKYNDHIVFRWVKKHHITSSIFDNDAPYFIHSVDDSYFEKYFNLSVWHSKQIDLINDFLDNYKKIKVLLGHVEEAITPIENNKTDSDETMIKDYFQKQGDEIGKAFQNFIDTGGQLANIFSERMNEQVEENSDFMFATNFFINNYKELYPDPSQDSKEILKVELNFDLIKKWKKRLDEQFENFAKFYIIILFDAMKTK